MKFTILMYTDPDHTERMSREEIDAIVAKHAEMGKELLANGELVGGEGMRAAKETTLLRLEDGGVISSVGPLHTPEDNVHLSAYYEVECDSLDRAEEIAGGLLDGHVLAVEVREIHDSVTEVG